MAAPSTTLLQTKLRPPQIAGSNVERPALYAKLDHYSQLRLTLVSAPAGSGKSHVVIKWLQTVDVRYGWVSLDETERDLGRFVRYLLAAIGGVCPDIELTTQFLLDSVNPLQPNSLAETLLCDVESLSEPLILVLDDYQNAEDADVRKFMTRFVQDIPEDLHLVLISRTDPLVPLARLRSQFQLGEIRNAELRFLLTEATELIGKLVEHTVEPEIVELLHSRTEGWITGLQLAAILLRSKDDHRALASQFAVHGHKWIVDYLVSEVLENLDARQRMRMLHASIFAEFSASMLEFTLTHLLEPGEGIQFLDELTKANLFLIPLDDAGVWYRYHHLFGELLSQRLRREISQEDIDALHLRAGAWFEDQGLIDNAIVEALTADAPLEAAKIVERHVHEALNREEWRDVERWLGLLPTSVSERTGILIARAFVQHFRHRFKATQSLIARAEVQLAAAAQDPGSANNDMWRGAVLALAAQDAHYRGESSRCLGMAQDALRLLPAECTFVRGIAEFYYISGLQQSGQTETALDYCADELALQIGKVNHRTARLYQGMAAVRYANAACVELQKVARAYGEVARRLDRDISRGWAHYLMGWSSYQMNDLPRAEANFRRIQQMRQTVHLRAVVDGYTGLALTLHANKRVAEARATVEELRDFLVQSGPLALTGLTDSLMNRLMLMDGERIKIPRIENLEDQLGGELWEMPALTTIRAVLCDGRMEMFPEAAELLTRIRNYVQNTNNTRRRIEVDVLSTLFYGALGETEIAIERLQSAVRLGATGEVIRTFLDEGPALRPYLEMLLVRNVERLYVQRILDAYIATPAAAAQTVSIPGITDLAEASFTNREIEVLLLLAERLTNDEIADRLVISTPTVKKHARNIYQKLDVANRRQAVMRARTLGILHPAAVTGEHS